MSLDAIINDYRQNTLKYIMGAALLFRLLAAVFSTGYGMHDDHFITIEVAQSWIDGVNRDQWLPEDERTAVPSGHSLTYPGILYGILLGCEKAGIDDPAAKMLIVRLLHALLSLVVVYCGYKIIQVLYNEKAAAVVGWLLALFWFMPMLSVRNLVEVVCIPFLAWGLWLIIKNKEEKWLPFLWAGIVTGLAFSIRFQTSMFIAGLGLALLIQRKWIPAFVFGAGVVISILLLQGTVDMIIWKRPFAEFAEYVNYNIHHAGDYPNGPWYNYLLLVAGLLIPPVSIFIIFGLLRHWKKHVLVLLPVLAFFLFHSAFPNKQERFIFPVIPFIIMAGVAGWMLFYNASSFWQRNRKLHRASWIFFAMLNGILLFALTLSSTKRNRVDAMRYLSHDRHVSCFVVENKNHSSTVSMPYFYLKKQWPLQYNLVDNNELAAFRQELDEPGKCMPQYVLFMEEKNIGARVGAFKKYFPDITYETTIQPSFLDQVMHWLNPVNVNQTTVIYRIN